MMKKAKVNKKRRVNEKVAMVIELLQLLAVCFFFLAAMYAFCLMMALFL